MAKAATQPEGESDENEIAKPASEPMHAANPRTCRGESPGEHRRVDSS